VLNLQYISLPKTEQTEASTWARWGHGSSGQMGPRWWRVGGGSVRGGFLFPFFRQDATNLTLVSPQYLKRALIYGLTLERSDISIISAIIVEP